jgi:hypothetical protein
VTREAYSSLYKHTLTSLLPHTKPTTKGSPLSLTTVAFMLLPSQETMASQALTLYNKERALSFTRDYLGREEA